MNRFDNEPDIFDLYDRDIKDIIYLFKKVTANDVAVTYSKQKPMVAVIESIKETDERIYEELVQAVKIAITYKV
jgi:hypothetical protein